MLSFFTKKPVPEKERILIERSLLPSLFLASDNQSSFNRNGYVHLKNILTANEITALTDLYHTASKMDGFQNTDYYINSIGFEHKGIRLFLKNNTEKILSAVLPRFIKTENADFPLGGGFCINPPHATKGCSPHQDPTCVDETESYSMTVWISLCDMTPENGCMNIIDGSHLWGNIHRSICVPWAFEKHADFLWKYMKPVPTKAGDVLCFDVSTIHASTANTTEKTRLAMTVQTIPKKLQLISYYPSGKEKADVYAIDKDYFIQESQYKKPSSKYKIVKRIHLNNHFTEKNIEQLNTQFLDLQV
jgi:hypothetical protein